MAAEQLRQRLLKETGITSWFPRYGLPGAAPSHDVCVNAPSIGVQPEDAAHIPAQLQAPASSLAQLSPIRVNSANAELVASKAADVLKNLHVKTDLVVPAQQPVKEPSPGRPAVAEPFGFSWFAIDKHLSILAMLPPDARQLSNTCHTMLQRLLVALHEPWQSVVLDEQSFHWPFADDPDLLADANAASQAVDGFIARRLRRQRSTMLLVLSDQLPWFLQQSPSDAEELTAGHLKIHRQYDLAMLCTHALHSMERDAGLKRAAWQSMQVVRERLTRI